MQEVSDGEHACQLAIDGDDGQVPDMLFKHELQRVVDSSASGDGLDRKRHDFPHPCAFRIAPLENYTKHDITFAENSAEDIALHYCDRPNAFLVHRTHGFADRCLGVYCYHRCLSDSQETHIVLLSFFAVDQASNSRCDQVKIPEIRQLVS